MAGVTPCNNIWLGIELIVRIARSVSIGVGSGPTLSSASGRCRRRCLPRSRHTGGRGAEKSDRVSPALPCERAERYSRIESRLATRRRADAGYGMERMTLKGRKRILIRIDARDAIEAALNLDRNAGARRMARETRSAISSAAFASRNPDRDRRSSVGIGRRSIRLRCRGVA